jgi:hypothetical protein
LDYTDIPQKYPLYSFFFPGKEKPAFQKRELSRITASLIANFSAALLETNTLEVMPESQIPMESEVPAVSPTEFPSEAPGERGPDQGDFPLAPQGLPEGGLHVETNGAWNSLPKGYIL